MHNKLYKSLLVLLSLFAAAGASAQTVYWSIVPEYDVLQPIKEGLYFGTKDDKAYIIDTAKDQLYELQRFKDVSDMPNMVAPYYDGSTLLLKKTFLYQPQGTHYQLVGLMDDRHGSLTFVPAPLPVNYNSGSVYTQTKADVINYYVDAFPFFSTSCSLIPAYTIEAGKIRYGYLDMVSVSTGSFQEHKMLAATEFKYEMVWPCERAGDKILSFVKEPGKSPYGIKLTMNETGGDDKSIIDVVMNKGKSRYRVEKTGKKDDIGTLSEWESRYPDMGSMQTVLGSSRFAYNAGKPDMGLAWFRSNIVVNSTDTIVTKLKEHSDFVKGKAICQTDQEKWGQLTYLPGCITLSDKLYSSPSKNVTGMPSSNQHMRRYKVGEQSISPNKTYLYTVVLPEGFEDKQQQVKGSCNDLSFRRSENNNGDPDSADPMVIHFLVDVPMEKANVRVAKVYLDGPVELYNDTKIQEEKRAARLRSEEFFNGIKFWGGKTAYADEAGNASVSATLKNEFKQAVTVRYGGSEFTLEPGESKTFGASRSNVFVATSVTFKVDIYTEGYDPIEGLTATVRINPY